MNVNEFNRVVNCTTHPVYLLGYGGRRIAIPRSPWVVWAVEYREPIGVLEVGGVRIPVDEISYGKPTGLPPIPENTQNTLWIVSPIALRAIQEHYPDLLESVNVAFVTDVVRDTNGRVVGAKALAIWKPRGNPGIVVGA